jgi:zinc/manganese transport system permease protein
LGVNTRPARRGRPIGIVTTQIKHTRATAQPLAVAPQPLLDGAEYMFPSLRTIYFTPAEQAALADASEHAERYRAEAERLNDLETRRRSEGQALDDFTVARISSLLRSYGEMRNGEQFVMTELCGRTRQRVRWAVSFALLVALTLRVAPAPWRRRWARASDTRRPA